MNTTFTVVMPAYNAAPYLAQTIESVLSQTFTDFELLIIDDGSTDNTAVIAEDYQQKDKRVKLLIQSNRGVSATRNQGIASSNSPYIAFIDADDKWFPDKLALHYQHLEKNPHLGVSYAKVEFLTPDGKHTRKIAQGRLTKLQPQHFLYENPTMTVSNLVIRRQVFEEIGCFDCNMNYSEDLDFLFRIACSQWKIEGIDHVLLGYRTTQGGLSSQLYKMEQGWETLMAKARLKAPELVEKHYLKARSNHLRYLARRAFRLHLSPQIGVDFLNRALNSDWQLILREPRRTLFTIVAVYGNQMLQYINLRKIISLF
ncbi:glycosyltransferase family 2 protein [Plectonema cf. radiosum LEGE 06105]|uniref:Glycosyltransferase family 2 protein n=1 Tax=Plectonema cf. radiosum LEGE 06105 TaxID=945769 RepID=A0A8J7K1V9_9CYAN|nr:glycosyltransferase family A protein [Plectonema radiosum]MBE9212352.1 glycosyltransferase family 2 protein [Plectonema cf. radiosum LEGE 06105]